MKTKNFLPRIWVILAIVYLCAALLFSGIAIFSKHLNYPFPFIGYGGTFRWGFFKIGSLKVNLYWFFMGVGFLGMVFLSVTRRKILEMSVVKAVLLALYLAVMGIVGAKVLYILENLDHVRQYGISFGGVSFFGTVLFMPLAIFILSLISKVKYAALMDFSAPVGVVMLSFIRIGCFCKGCCGGITVWINSNPWVLPVQLIEAALDLILLYALLRMENNSKLVGARYMIFMGVYGSYRFVLEFLREGSPESGLFRNGHIFSLICMALLIIFMVIRSKRSKLTF